MSKNQHSTPCKQCPWLKSSLPGYLGNSDPVEFLQCSESETRMPCHCHVDYEADDWQEQAEEAPQCAGRAIHFANRCKLPRLNPDLLKVEKRSDAVFTNPQDFIDHHSRGEGPRIGLLGLRVLILEVQP